MSVCARNPQGIACTCTTATLSLSFSLFLPIPFISAAAISNGETAIKKYPDIYQGNDETARIAARLQDNSPPGYAEVVDIWIHRNLLRSALNGGQRGNSR